MYEWQLSTRLRLLRPSLLLMGIPFACAPAIQTTGMEPVVADRMYFSRNIADTLGASDSAWPVFVADIVSARLPRGFTFWKAEWQWRGVAVRPQRESSFEIGRAHV